MIHSQNDFAFRAAAENGRLDIIKKLLELTPDEPHRFTMIHSENDFAFRLAAQNGLLDIIEELLKLTPDEPHKSNMIHSENDFAFRAVAENGRLNIMRELIELTTDQYLKSKMVNNFCELLDSSTFLNVAVYEQLFAIEDKYFTDDILAKIMTEFSNFLVSSGIGNGPHQITKQEAENMTKLILSVAAYKKDFTGFSTFVEHAKTILDDSELLPYLHRHSTEHNAMRIELIDIRKKCCQEKLLLQPVLEQMHSLIYLTEKEV